jgi:hypothetical protein
VTKNPKKINPYTPSNGAVNAPEFKALWVSANSFSNFTIVLSGHST